MVAAAASFTLDKFREAIDPNIRILVVDDSQTMRRIITTNLKELGLKNIVTKEDGDVGLEAFNRENIELVLCDHKMPNMTGVEMLRHVRQGDHNNDVPFIMVTAESFKENVMEAVKLGVSNYIVKPFSSQQLMEKIAKTLLTIQVQKAKSA